MSSAAEPTSAATETRVSHAGETVIALHAGEAAVAGAAKRTVGFAGILALKALRSKTFGRRAGGSVSANALIAAAEVLGSAAEVLSAKSLCHLAIGIRHA